ncbi:MAG: hypothetical protein MPK09_01060 [Gammaproteobacteria bacterium]|nr:hypothetical protein [Alphaproteobacteria bacterium]MDA8014189.1 hypothetical protein [Gammaproteobacteria bacterium]MDA8021992.1 hypothetical protein [Gammaproteobacteria bacterium]
MKKYTCVFATLVALCFTFANATHAQQDLPEVTLGAYYGPSKIELTGAGALQGSVTGTGREVGVFLQVHQGMFGLHGAFGVNSTKVDATIRRFGQQDSFTEKAGRSLDLMGMLFIEGRRINGIGMLGFTRFETEASGDISGGGFITGLKYAVGFDVPFPNGWVAQLAYEYANLGELNITGTADRYELEESGLRLRIGARY